jgi:hypothetical protein
VETAVESVFLLIESSPIEYVWKDGGSGQRTHERGRAVKSINQKVFVPLAVPRTASLSRANPSPAPIAGTSGSSQGRRNSLAPRNPDRRNAFSYLYF